MDEIWVPSETTKSQTENSGVTTPVKVVPHSLDLTKYKDANRGGKIDELDNNFTFGFVGEFIERKNIKALVQAFHMTFDPMEPVNLFIKTSKATLNEVENYCLNVRNGLKLRKNYKKEIVIVGMMENDDYISVLNQVDCFVMPSKGEAFCIPGLEAMALGIPSIYTMFTGMDYLVGQPVRSHKTPCFGAMETLAELDTAESTWQEIEVDGLSETMRYMYSHLSNQENKKGFSEQCKNCLLYTSPSPRDATLSRMPSSA